MKKFFKFFNVTLLTLCAVTLAVAVVLDYILCGVSEDVIDKMIILSVAVSAIIGGISLGSGVRMIWERECSFMQERIFCLLFLVAGIAIGVGLATASELGSTLQILNLGIFTCAAIITFGPLLRARPQEDLVLK